jgi:tRNA1Val (adenine37-N6)-methyltransferase
MPNKGETKIKESRAGAPMPVSTDSLLLADFVEVAKGERILDLGTGGGVVAMALAAREEVKVVGIDNQIEAVEAAQKKYVSNKGFMRGECEFEPGDFRNEEYIRRLGVFSQVVCNPPYHKAGEGRLPPASARACARHEITCTLEDVAQAADWALPEGGVFSFVMIPKRMAESFSLLAKIGFSVYAVRPVYTHSRQDAELVLIRAIKGANGALRLMEPRQLRALNRGE